MAMQYAEGEYRARGQEGVARIVAALREVFGDVPLPVSVGEETGGKSPKEEREKLLLVAIQEYELNLHTPELVTKTHQVIWRTRGEVVGVTYEVIPCSYTQKELSDLEANGKRVGYLPAELATQQSRHVLGKMFTQLGSYSVQEGNPVTNEVDRSGWFDYEVSIDAPYRNTTEGQLRKAIADAGKKLGRDLAGMNVSEYIVASEDSKLLTGKFLDQGDTRVRLLGSRLAGWVVDASFLSGGFLLAYWHLLPQAHDPRLGGRSVGAKKA